jgi:hypothetical protein
MRLAASAGLAVLLLAPHAVRASDPYRATVADEEVKLRAGPSDAFPETGTLKRGAVVVVEREESGGWVAVTAPYGSVSWIATQFIEDPTPDKPTPKNVLVHADDEVTLAAGKAGEAQPLDIRRVKIPNGTALLLLGPKATFAGKTWYPVSPPAGDVRYLPKTAIKYDRPVNNTVAVRVTEPGAPLPSPAPSAPVASIPNNSGVTPAAGVTASKPAVNHPLWVQADNAEREGRYLDAEKALFDLAAVMNGPDGDRAVADQCFTRIHTLREKRRNGGTAVPLPTTSVLQPPREEKKDNSGGGVGPGVPQAIPASTAKPNPTSNPPLPSPADTNTTEGAKWTGVGTLRRTVVTPDGTGRPAFALETAPGVVKVYVVAGADVDLRKWDGKKVDVYGVQQPSRGLSRPYVVATAVEPAQ